MAITVDKLLEVLLPLPMDTEVYIEGLGAQHLFPAYMLLYSEQHKAVVFVPGACTCEEHTNDNDTFSG